MRTPLTIYFDLDDTLIGTQVLFEETKSRCATYVQSKIRAKHIPEITSIIETFNSNERELMEPYGLRNSRFVLSWIATLQFYAGKNAAWEKELRYLASRVFRASAKRFYDSIPVLETLKEAGHHLHLLTAGETETQQFRIQEAGLTPYFETITVVLNKNITCYEQLTCDKNNSVMVGNSLSSDIYPSLAAGMHAIQVEGDSWFMDWAEPLQNERLKKGSLKEVPELIAEFMQESSAEKGNPHPIERVKSST